MTKKERFKEINKELERISCFEDATKVEQFIETLQINLSKIKEDNISTALSDTEQTLHYELKEMKDKYIRTIADTENYKKRITNETNSFKEYANYNLIEKLLPNIDLFDKVVNQQVEDNTLKNFLIGFQMICNNIKNVLELEGVKKIQVKIGDEFNPKYHHAMETVENNEYLNGVIVEILQDGYMIKDRLLRNVIVKVNKIKEQKEEENE